MGILYSLQEVSYRYSDKDVLRELSFDIQKGEFVGILGANGSGKTTLLRLLAGYLKPQEGHLEMEGQELSKQSVRNRARKIAVVPQQFDVLFPFSVKEVVMMGRWAHISPLNWENEQDYKIAHEAMELTDCLEFQDRLVTELSGGEKERVLLARALTQEASVLLLDEPTTHLDLKHQVEIYNLLKTLHHKKNLTIITVLHDLNFAQRACERLLMLHEGRLAAFGKSGDLMNEENLKRVFGVEMQQFKDESGVYFLPKMNLK